jgi:putative toxin-antitoxin system antitoxin component (TIGR02293 family)
MTPKSPKKVYQRGIKREIDIRDYGILFFWTDSGFSPLKSRVIEVKVPDEGRQVWGRSLGLHLHNTEAVIESIRAGLTMDSFERFSKAIEIAPVHLADIASIARRTLARRKQEGRLQLAESERVFRLATLFDKAVEVLGDKDRARRWFKMPLKALAGKSPIEYSDTEIGAREVEDLLGRLEHGVFS